MQESDNLKQTARYHRVLFVRGGKPDSVVFPGFILADRFLKSLHSSKKGRIEPAPELESRIVQSSSHDCPAGTVIQCPRGPRVRTWPARKPKTIRRYPDFSKNVLNLPRQSAGFSLTYPEEASMVTVVVARHDSVEAASLWATYRYPGEADGEWYPKDEPKSKKGAGVLVKVM